MNMPSFLRRLLTVFALAASASVASAGDQRTLTQRTLTATDLNHLGVPHNLHLAQGGLELARGVVIEDDGPAAGFSYQPQTERLQADLLVKKELLAPRPQAKAATLMVAPGGELQLKLNGRDVKLGEASKSGNYWQTYQLDPALLREGSNEFIFGGKGQFWIARDDEYAAGSTERRKHVNRSSRSLDGGKTWTDTRLGMAGDIDGEYYVRLFLDQFVAEGQVVSPVVDLRNLSEQPIAPAGGKVNSATISVDVEQPASGKLSAEARWSSDPRPSGKWSDWKAIDLDADGKIAGPLGRYLQIRLRVSSNASLASPRIKALRIGVEGEPTATAQSIRVIAADTQPLVRSSIPFAYEPFDQPRLKELRQKYKLDEVVAGSSSELQELGRLAAWSATRWEKTGHLKDIYPVWCALDILTPHADGTPIGGFCQQRSLVFLQAAESLGHVGRVVSIGSGDRVKTYRGGHETTEIWSNQFHKWIHVDGDNGWYFVDNETDVPLSFLELRERQMDHLAGKTPTATRCVRLIDQERSWSTFADKPAFVELRLVPRSNFLEQASPLPLNQGMRGWFWTGHYVWSDDREPTRPLYVHRVTRREDFEWDVNRTQILLTATKQPDELQVTLITETPGFADFVKEENGVRATTPATFVWKLRSGKNQLWVTSQNSAGKKGVPSTVELDYSP